MHYNYLGLESDGFGDDGSVCIVFAAVRFDCEVVFGGLGANQGGDGLLVLRSRFSLRSLHEERQRMSTNLHVILRDTKYTEITIQLGGTDEANFSSGNRRSLNSTNALLNLKPVPNLDSCPHNSNPKCRVEDDSPNTVRRLISKKLSLGSQMTVRL